MLRVTGARLPHRDIRVCTFWWGWAGPLVPNLGCAQGHQHWCDPGAGILPLLQHRGLRRDSNRIVQDSCSLLFSLMPKK